MFHPNVYADGGICLDILQNRWSPTYDVSAILTSIQVTAFSIEVLNADFYNTTEAKNSFIIEFVGY